MESRSSPPEAANSFFWVAVCTASGEVCIPAASVERSAELTRQFVENWHLVTPSPELDIDNSTAQRKERDISLYTHGYFVGGGSKAGDEESAFLTWLLIAHLTYQEGLVRWRIGFPLPPGEVDQLEAIMHEEIVEDQGDAWATEGRCRP